MSPAIPNNNSRSAQSMMAIGAVIVAAATSIYIVHSHQTHRRKKRPSPSTKDADKNNSDNTNTTNGNEDGDENNFYKQLGISEENLPPHIQREILKERKRKAKVELISMKTPMYDNIFMLDRNGERLSTISSKKARWYVRKGIGEWSSFKNDDNVMEGESEKTCIRLLFEHNGSANSKNLGTDETLYLRSAKQNICVRCGDDNHHIRHYIVPYSYRYLLPEQYKTHMSHDIVILCPDCHIDCDRHSKRRMRDMERDLRMKLEEGAYERPVIGDMYLGQVRSCAIALVKWKDGMPLEKIEGYDKTVREYLASEAVCTNEEERDALLSGEEALTKSQLQKACGVKYRVKNPDYMQGAEVVVRSLKDARSTEEFIVDWRKHFIATVNPQHMPAGWRVENPVACRVGEDGDDSVKTW